jgi:hypothetical protein
VAAIKTRTFACAYFTMVIAPVKKEAAAQNETLQLCTAVHGYNCYVCVHTHAVIPGVRSEQILRCEDARMRVLYSWVRENNGY